MRLDKYLKNTRIIKRRTIAKELLDLGRVEINNRVAKPSSEVNINDKLRLKLKDRYLNIIVTNIILNPKIEESSNMFRIISEEYF